MQLRLAPAAVLQTVVAALVPATLALSPAQLVLTPGGALRGSG
jgi:hypothetical protein